jgi:ATPase subunit of ABC transporter with duplicated ATPase domains
MLLFTLSNFLGAFQNNEFFLLIGYNYIHIYSSVTNSIFFSFKQVKKRKGNHNPIERKREKERTKTKREKERTIKRQKRQRNKEREKVWALKKEGKREREKSTRKKDMRMLTAVDNRA